MRQRTASLMGTPRPLDISRHVRQSRRTTPSLRPLSPQTYVSIKYGRITEVLIHRANYLAGHEQDIFIASGCSGALEIVIGSLFNEGDNILLPSPGFSLYETLATSKNIECRFYSLLPDKNWEADMSELEGMVDGRTRGIIVNNPSNPCGSVYSKEHLVEILEFCERKRVPVIADEIYSDMTFDEHVFYPMASLTNTVPILSVGGLAKKWLVPGWRVGWICIYDRGNAFAEVGVFLVDVGQVETPPPNAPWDHDRSARRSMRCRGSCLGPIRLCRGRCRRSSPGPPEPFTAPPSMGSR
jgi:histidinol-phosphate/aromatic aminotransferase/cobyric acid decarboxylase-like protein